MIDDGSGADRDDHGRFSATHSDAEVVAAVRAHEPAATSEVADELDMARQSADYRLRQLREDGRVASKKIGASLVWFTVAGDDDHDDPTATATDLNQDHAAESEQAPGTASTGPDTQMRDKAEQQADATPDVEHIDGRVRATVERVAESWEDDSDRLDARKRAAVAGLQYALDAESAVGRSEVVDALHGEYAVPGQSERTWYRKNIRPVLADIANYSHGEHGYPVDAADLDENEDQ